MSDEIKKDENKYVFKWKTFLIDAAIAIVIMLVLQFFGAICYNGYVKFQGMMDRFDRYEQQNQEQYDQRQFDGKRDRQGININIDGDNVRPFRDRRADRLSIEEWVQGHLPPQGKKDYKAVSDVFYDIVKKLKKGSLKYDKDTFSYAVQQLQVAGPKKVWGKFYSGLTKQLVNEKTSNQQDLIDVFTRIADTIASEIDEDYDDNSINEGDDEDIDKDIDEDEDEDEEDGDDAETAAPNAVPSVEPTKDDSQDKANVEEKQSPSSDSTPKSEEKNNADPVKNNSTPVTAATPCSQGNCPSGTCYPYQRGGR